MANPLTQVEARALDFIKTFIAQNGYSPTVREITDAMGYKTVSTAFGVLERLERKGHISKRDGGPRTIRLMTDDEGPEKIIEDIKALFKVWNMRGICEDHLEGDEQDAMLELIELCEELVVTDAKK